MAYAYVLLTILGGIILALIGAAAYLAPANHWEFDIRYLWFIMPIPAAWLLFIWLCRLVPAAVAAHCVIGLSVIDCDDHHCRSV